MELKLDIGELGHRLRVLLIVLNGIETKDY